MGLGDDYNEDLLEAMAQSGDGNYYYIESPQQLADIF
jgi:Ca-activated chloride channel family protein